MSASALPSNGRMRFGLPAEQYAIKSGQHPALTTRRTLQFKSQLKGSVSLTTGSAEINTTDPGYYK